MKVIIVGDGVAGLSLANMLQKYCKSIKIIQNNSLNQNNIHNVGIWSFGAKILSNIGIIDPNKDLCYVHNTSYRTPSNYTLASPSFNKLDGILHDDSHISKQPKKPTLGFLTEEFLLNKLYKNLNNQVSIECSEIKSINTETNTIKTIITTTATTTNTAPTTKANDEKEVEVELSYDLLVIADGMYSSTRSLIWKHLSISSFLCNRGYVVYRGTSPRLVDNQEGFQTWGPGKRFAVVPSVNNTNAWYAAISTQLLKSNSLENSDMRGKKDGIECSDDDLNELSALFHDWHDPISSLISKSLRPITRTIAKASPTPYSLLSKDTNSNNNSSLLSSYNSIVCLGDAYHTLDPILAQGTGVAIEDAAHLVECLKYYGLKENENEDKDDNTSIRTSKDDKKVYNYSDHEIISRSLKLFQEQRKNRINRLHFLSDAAQLVGHIDSPFFCSIRNLKLSLYFKSLSSFFFDQAIMASLGGREWPTKK